MKPTLKNQPNSYAHKGLMVNFDNGKPLSCDQLNFLYRHERALSNPHLDSVMHYYLKHYYKHKIDEQSFLLPQEALTPEVVNQLKRRLRLLLQAKSAKLEMNMTPKQFMQFKIAAHQELILYHGNQFLTGAPFHPGGIPHIIYFQWGNLFGVAKYVILAEEKALKSNVLIYFEDMQERDVHECIHDYNLQHLQTLDEHKQLLPTSHPQEELSHHSPFKIPTLTLSRSKDARDSESS